MRVVIAEDSVLLREGLTRLLTEAGHEVAAAEGDAEKFLRAVAAHTPGRGRGRRPDAAHLHRRGAACGPGGPGPLAGHRRARPVPVGGGAVRHRADLRAPARGRLPAQGPGRGRRRVPRRAAPGGRGRQRARSRSRRAAARPQPPPARRAHPARARGARADGRGPVELRHRRARSWSAAARWKSTSTTSSPSSGWRPATATTVACSPCCATWAPDETGTHHDNPARHRAW